MQLRMLIDCVRVLLLSAIMISDPFMGSMEAAEVA